APPVEGGAGWAGLTAEDARRMGEARRSQGLVGEQRDLGRAVAQEEAEVAGNAPSELADAERPADLSGHSRVRVLGDDVALSRPRVRLQEALDREAARRRESELGLVRNPDLRGRAAEREPGPESPRGASMLP